MCRGGREGVHRPRVTLASVSGITTEPPWSHPQFPSPTNPSSNHFHGSHLEPSCQACSFDDGNSFLTLLQQPEQTNTNGGDFLQCLLSGF